MAEIFTPQQQPAGEFSAPQPADLLPRLLQLAQSSAEKPRVLIDGPSGSGKSTLGKFLARELGAQLVQMDHVYASWDGLAEAGERAARELLAPLAAGKDGKIRHWDWHNNCPAHWQEVSHNSAVVIEGSAALNRMTAPLATLRIWVEVADESARKIRALEQRPGGDIYAPYWEYWGEQEKAHIALHQPRELADILLCPGVAAGEPLYRLAGGELPEM